MEIKENVAYWCKTEELAKEFLKECERQQIKWHSGKIATSQTYWEYYNEKTCYYKSRNSLYFAGRIFCQLNGMKIIKYKGEINNDKTRNTGTN